MEFLSKPDFRLICVCSMMSRHSWCAAGLRDWPIESTRCIASSIAILGEDLDYFVDHGDAGVCKPRVVLLVLIVPITELGGGCSVSKFHEELDDKRTV